MIVAMTVVQLGSVKCMLGFYSLVQCTQILKPKKGSCHYAMNGVYIRYSVSYEDAG